MDTLGPPRFVRSCASFLARVNSAPRDASSFSLRTLSSKRSALRRERGRRSALAAATSSAN